MLAGAGQDDDPHRVLGVGEVECGVDLVDERRNCTAFATSGRFMVTVATAPSVS